MTEKSTVEGKREIVGWLFTGDTFQSEKVRMMLRGAGMRVIEQYQPDHHRPELIPMENGMGQSWKGYKEIRFFAALERRRAKAINATCPQ